MKLIVLGTGTSIPLSYRASPSLLLIIEDSRILFDMGPGTMRQLSRIGIGHDTIEHIFISHFHPDHTADLIHLLFATRYPPILEKREKFLITGPCGLRDFLNRLRKAYGRWLDIPSETMEIEELDIQKPEKRIYRNMKITSQPLTHTPNSLAYRVSGPSGESLVYSGDTGFCDEIVDLARGSDLLILECSFPDEEEQEGHLTPSLAGRIASMAQAKRLLLTHFYPDVLKTDIAGACRRTYNGELILGRDLLHISV